MARASHHMAMEQNSTSKNSVPILSSEFSGRRIAKRNCILRIVKSVISFANVMLDSFEFDA